MRTQEFEMTITLPDELRIRLERRARLNGYSTIEDYLAGLVEDDPADDRPGPPGISPRDRAELEAMLDDGMKSGPAVIADAAFWEERRRVLEERIAQRNRATT
jgi:hypothetical protein